MSYGKPETAAPGLSEAGVDSRGWLLYLRSYFVMRTAIGVLGIGLPALLLGGDLLFLRGSARARGSLSAYYYSGMRDAFVGVLVATGIFLITYKVVDRHLDNVLSVLAGTAVLGVALFPAGQPVSGGQLTPLQQAWGERTVASVHFVCAAAFILSLAVISFLFGVREGRRTRQRIGRRARLSPSFWRRFHWTCASVIVLAVLFVAVTKLLDRFDDYSLIIGETAAVLAFGLSWLLKGLELDVFRSAATVESSPVRSGRADQPDRVAPVGER